MRLLENLLERLSRADLSGQVASYEPTEEEMKYVIQFFGNIGVILQRARVHGAHGAHGVLASPARVFGYVPESKISNVIEESLCKINDAYSKAFLRNALEWAAMNDEENSSSEGVDLFEPIFSLIVRGCRIRLHKGFLEVGGNLIPLHTPLNDHNR